MDVHVTDTISAAESTSAEPTFPWYQKEKTGLSTVCDIVVDRFGRKAPLHFSDIDVEIYHAGIDTMLPAFHFLYPVQKEIDFILRCDCHKYNEIAIDGITG